MTLLADSKRPWLLKTRSSETFIVVVICVALVTDLLIYSFIVPILPNALRSRAGVPQEFVQKWTSILLAAYGATLAIGSPVLGYISDRTGSRRIPFILGLVALGLSTIFFMFATAPWVFLVARALQGVSASAVYVVGLAMIAETVEESRVPQAMGFAGTSMTIGSLLGPAIGGFTYERFGYYATFVLPVALVVIDIVLRLLMIEKPVSTSDQQQQSSASASHQPTTDNINTSQSVSDQEITTEHTRLLSPPDSSTEESQTKQVKNPAGVFYLLRSTRLSLTLVAMIVSQLILPAFEATLPIFLAETFHWTASNTGLVFLAFSIPSLMGGPAGMIVARVGTRWPSIFGYALSAIVLSCLRFVSHNTTGDKVLLITLLVLNTLGGTMVQVCLMTQTFRVVGEAEMKHPGIFGDKSPVAQVYGLLSVAAASSHFTGPLLGGFVKETAGWNVLTLMLGVTCGAMALAVVYLG